MKNVEQIDSSLAAGTTGTFSDLLHLPDAVADFGRSEIRHADGGCFGLSVTEAALLQFLAAHPGRAVSRDEILRHVWHLDPRRLLTRTIDMHIVHLRYKLRDDPIKPRVLFTVRGEGYMFARPGQPQSPRACDASKAASARSAAIP